MSVVYREITNRTDLHKCLDLQQKVFGLKDEQTIPMLILAALGGNPTRCGLVVGAYDTEINDLIGFSITICTAKPGSLFIVASGMLPEYHNSRSGTLLFENLFRIAKENGIDYMEYYFNPLKTNLGRLYFNYCHSKGIIFQYNVFPEIENSHRIYAKCLTLPVKEHAPHKNMDFDSIPLLTNDVKYPPSDTYLLAIPEEGEDTTFFFQTLDQLINHESYCMENCISRKETGRRRHFYVLHKEPFHQMI